MRYVGGVLRRLGYRVRLRVFPDPPSYFDYINDPRHPAQLGTYGWVADILTPSSFFEPFSCSAHRADPRFVTNPSQFCDPAVDAGYRAALAARGPEANARWAALDRQALAATPLVPLFSRRTLLLVSDRVGNVQMHQQLGPLLDQLWVH
jgi:peptide/nickel transport system substrate-binding protein